LSFDGAGTDVNSPPPSWYTSDSSTKFLLGSLYYHNAPIYAGSGITGAGLDVLVTITDPNGAGVSDWDFTMSVNETTNPQGDTVIILGPAPGEQTFTYDGRQFVFDVLGFSLDNGLTMVTSVYNPECGDKNLGLYGQIRWGTPDEPPPAVPDGGATVMFLGLAVAGLGALRRVIG
jgi:hypothetical protein